MTEDQEVILCTAGEVIGVAMRFLPEQYEAVAEVARLRPEFKKMILQVAAFRRELSEVEKTSTTSSCPGYEPDQDDDLAIE